jgi:DEAD/DEAH box helicase domain-containing protein
MIEDFVEYLKHDDYFAPQTTAYKYLSPESPEHREIAIKGPLRGLLASQGITSLWSHQVEGIDLVRKGRNIVVMTPTASGKSLIYNIPVIETILDDPASRALYLFPLKGLEQDQLKNLNSFLLPLCIKGNNSKRSLMPAEIYDGDTTAYRRKRIREANPGVIFTNPDMLHHAINAYHQKWEDFFRNLRFVVVDEIHAYRGIFGSNVAHVLRRLRRICDRWGSSPQFIASSATIANPEELAEKLTGLPFESVTDSGAPRGGRHFVFINPHESPYTVALRLFILAVRRGLKTILFTKARKITELIYAWCIKSAPELIERISPYRAGFLPEERRIIEERLFSGELSGVISTSALELGIDIGGLDCCILLGYPGSISSTWQRAGRVGRKGRESLILMIGLHDALDQYILRHSETIFEKSHEAAIVDPDNEIILRRHLPCAAQEVYLSQKERVYDLRRIIPVIESLVNAGSLRRGRSGDVWFSGIRMPHRMVDIRGIGEVFRIIDIEGGIVGELNGVRIFREAFPGAIYLHRGRQYLVKELSIEKKMVRVEEVDAGYYTRALSNENTELLSSEEKREVGGITVQTGELRISRRVIGYERRGIYDRARLSRHPLDLPEYVFDTRGLWMVISDDIRDAVEGEGYDLMGSLHALEHASISSMPLYALCEKADIGGVSYTFYPEFENPCIFVYDGYEGGVGYCSRAYEVAEAWLRTTYEMISECSCEAGCPSCIQDPQCGSGNQPLDKDGARYLLELIMKDV